MATTGAIKAGRAFYEFFAETSPLVRGMRSAEKEVNAWGKRVAAAGAGLQAIGGSVLTGLATAATLFAQNGTALQLMSQRTGIAVESLSELSHAAQVSGASLETVEGALGNVNNVMLDAAQGSLEAELAFRKVGLSWTEVQKMTPEQKLESIADGLAKISNPAQRAAAATKLLGGSAQQLLPMLSRGSAGLKEMRAEAKRLGIVMSGEDAASAQKLSSAWSTLTQTAMGVVNVIGAAMAPTFTEIVSAATEITAEIIQFAKANRETIVTIAKIAAAVAAAGVAVTAIGAAILGAGAVIGAFGTILAAAASVCGLLAGAFTFLISPLGLVLVAVTGVTAAVLYFSGAGSETVKVLMTEFGKLAAFATEVFGGISDALAAGDLALAGKVAWSALMVVWTEGVHQVNEVWTGAKEFFLSTWADAVSGLALMFTDAWAGIQTGWLDLMNTFQRTWYSTQNAISKGVLRVLQYFDKSIDVEGASQILDEDFQREQAKASSKHTERRQEIEQERQGARQEIVEQNQRDRDERERTNNESLRSTRKAAEEAGKEFADARATAAKKAEEVRANRKFGTGPNATAVPSLENLRQRASSVGTFSGAAVRGLFGGGTVQDRIAAASEKTAKNTGKLLTQNTGPTWK